MDFIDRIIPQAEQEDTQAQVSKGLEVARKIAGKGAENRTVPVPRGRAGNRGERDESCSPCISVFQWPELLADIFDEESTNRRGRFIELYKEELIRSAK